jgi:hypothetical protein
VIIVGEGKNGRERSRCAARLSPFAAQA